MARISRVPVWIGEPAAARSCVMPSLMPSSVCVDGLAEADQHVGIDELDLALDERQADLRSPAASACGCRAAATARCWRCRPWCGRARSPPACGRATCPERPTNGSPSMSSSRPGASPTNISRACGLPSANTSCVAVALAARSPRSGRGWRAARRGWRRVRAASRAAITAASGGGRRRAPAWRGRRGAIARIGASAGAAPAVARRRGRLRQRPARLRRGQPVDRRLADGRVDAGLRDRRRAVRARLCLRSERHGSAHASMLSVAIARLSANVEQRQPNCEQGAATRRPWPTTCPPAKRWNSTW